MKAQNVVALGITIASAAVLAAGCSPTESRLETRSFELNRITSEQAVNMVSPYVYSDRAGAAGALSAGGRVLTVRELPENLDRIAAVLSEFDQERAARRPVQLQFQLIHANGYSEADPRIADVVDDLGSLFRFDGFQLVGEAVLNIADGEFSQLLKGLDEDRSWSLNGMGFNELGGAFGLTVELHMAPRPGPGTKLFATGVPVTPGQTLVLGSAELPRSDGAVILVVRASEGTSST